MKAFFIFCILFSLWTFGQVSLETEVNQSKCAQETCTSEKTKELCGQCCNRKFRFTNQDDGSANYSQKQNAANVSLGWDECIACCKDGYPEGSNSNIGNENVIISK